MNPSPRRPRPVFPPRPVTLLFLLVGSIACLGAPPALAAPALGAHLGATAPAKPDPGPPYQGGGRVGGDWFEDATVMPSWLFTDTGNTCGYADNVNEVCPYEGGTAPDVVYRYDCTSSMPVAVDLCASSYDTKVSVYDGSVDNLIGCNDDAGCGYSGYQSRLENVYLEAGHTYYFVIDGYGNSCGNYTFSTTDVLPCAVDCPADAQIEGEPPCVDGYWDAYNGGCQTVGWTPVLAGPDGCATVCGRSCTYIYQGLSYRDMDWYTATAAGGPVTLTCTAEFPLQLILIYDPDCNGFQYSLVTAGTCQEASLTMSLAAGQEFWPWVEPSTFTGVPEGGYVFHLCGLQVAAAPGACCLAGGECIMVAEPDCLGAGGEWNGAASCTPNPCLPTPVVPTTWGRIKLQER